MHPSWREFCKNEWGKPYFKRLSDFLKGAYAATTVYPPKAEVFRALETDFAAVRVVILGQDPYHGAGQAHGLAFSVREGTAAPPSLQNIFKEITAETGRAPATGGDLSRWAAQGVLLLNNTLTVEAGRPGSHRGIGWEEFTAAAMARLDAERDGLVFMLWGRDARDKKRLIDGARHLILEAAHPSPFSANSGFFGCGHFTRANDHLRALGRAPVEW